MAEKVVVGALFGRWLVASDTSWVRAWMEHPYEMATKLQMVEAVREAKAQIDRPSDPYRRRQG